MRKMAGRGAGPSVDTTCLKTEDGDTLTDPEERAAIFLETYDLSSNKGPILTNICPLVREKIDSEEANPLNSVVCMEELDAVLGNLKNSATGADLIHNRMLSKMDSTNRDFLLPVFKIRPPKLEGSRHYPCFKAKQAEERRLFLPPNLSYFLPLQVI